MDLTFAEVRARGRLEPTTCRVIFGSSCPPAPEADADAYERALRLEVDELAGGLSRVGQLFVGPQQPFGVALTADEGRELALGLVERGLSLLAITGVALDAVEATPAFAADHGILQILVAEAAVVLEETRTAIETEGWRSDGRDRLLGGRLIASVCKAIDTLSADARALSGLDSVNGPDNVDLCESGLPNPSAAAVSG